MTKRAEERIWKEFQDWCRVRRLRGLPAHPWTLAAYIRWMEPRHRQATLLKRIGVISKVHAHHALEPPDRHPIVHRTLRMIEARRKAAKRKASLFRDDDFLAPAPAGLQVSKPKRTGKKKRLGLSVRPKLISKRPGVSEA